LSALLKAAVSHVQFETIHPFLDGNGRVGRLLITFILCAEEILSEPLLYLSLYLKQNRDEYYRLLQDVRVTGEWEAWIRFFMCGVLETANQAVATAKKVLQMFDQDRVKVEKLGAASGSALRLYLLLQKQLTIAPFKLSETQVQMSIPTLHAAINR